MKKRVLLLFVCLVIGVVNFMWLFPSYLILNNKFHNWNKSYEVYHLWLIFTKASTHGDLVTNIRKLLQSLCAHSTVPFQLNLISDNSSKTIASNVINIQENSNCSYSISYYDKDESINKIKEIVDVMTPHFSSVPGAYYSDPFYYLSLGLHKIAPNNQNKVILIDCDIIFEEDVYLLFEEFKKFSSTNLFGLAHELSSVYRHGLHEFRSKNNAIYIGEPVSFTISDNNSTSKNIASQNVMIHGFPGFNSGVVLLNLEKIRQSPLYHELLLNKTVVFLTKKYSFKGSLGDQDYYTLLYLDYPDIFYTLHCGWNRQLCKWWNRQEDHSLFNEYFKCPPPIYVYHKNCHSSLPSDILE